MRRMKKVLAAVISAALLCGTVAVPALPASAADSIEDKYEWGTLEIGGGGFVSGIVTGKKVMYARTDVGGAYRFNYETDRWEQLFDFLPEADRGLLSVDAMAIDPTDDNTVYFLCGCAYFSDAETVIFKTTDGGKTFKKIDVTDLIQVHGNGYGRQCGEAIAIDPDNPKVLYCGGDVASGSSALIKSEDGGETWAPVKGYDDLGYYKHKVMWPFWTNHEVRACTTDDPQAYGDQNGVATIAITGGKVYVGTSVVGEAANMVVADVKDDKFTPLDKSLPTDLYPSRINFDADGNLLITYVAGLKFDGANGGIFRYNPKTGKLDDISPKPNGFGACISDPKDANKLYATTLGVWSFQYYSKDDSCFGEWMYRSEDGGKTWDTVYSGKKDGVWVYDEELGDMTDHQLYSYTQTGNYGWIYKKAIHWSGSMMMDPTNPDRIYVVSGNGVFRWDNIWGKTADDSPVATFHPDGIEEVVSMDFVSTPDGLDLSAIGDYDGFIHTSVDSVPEQYNPNMGSTSSIAVCPQNTDIWARIAMGDGNNQGSGYYSTDRGKTWQVLKGVKTKGKLAITELSKGKYRILNADEKSGMIYTDDFGATWESCSGLTATAGLYPMTDPNDPTVIYVSGAVFNEYWNSDPNKKEPTFEESHYSLYVSTDSGATFKEYTACEYGYQARGIYTNTCDLAYVTKDTVALAGDIYGIVMFSDKGEKKEVLPFAYAKSIGYGKPEKEGGPNTLFVYGKPTEKDTEGIYRSTDAGKTWVCINTQKLYGGTGNGNYLVGDMDEFGKVYMSTVGCGIVYGQPAGTAPKPTEPKTTEPKPTETKPAETKPAETKPTETTTPGAKPTVQYCDANCDGEITIMDVIAVNKQLLGIGNLSDQGKANADADASGTIDSEDSLNVLKRVIELLKDADFPIKKA